MAPSFVGLIMETIARRSKPSSNHHVEALIDDAALSPPSSASTNPAVDPISGAGPHHTNPFLLTYTNQYYGPLTEAESVFLTVGDAMPTYPGVLTHAACVYAPENLTQQYLEEYLANNFSGNWVISQDPAAITAYYAAITEVALAYAEAEAERQMVPQGPSREDVFAFLEGLEEVSINSLAENSRECSICRGIISPVPLTSHPRC